jgi:hypothetical protein
VLEPLRALHLHLQQHHRLLSASLVTPRPERTIQAVIHRFELWGLKSVDGITRRIRPKTGRSSARQQQSDQIRRALEQAIEPVVRFHGAAADRRRRVQQRTTTEHCTRSRHSTPVLAASRPWFRGSLSVSLIA